MVKLTLYEAVFGTRFKSESAFFFAESDEQAEDFACIIKDEIGREIRDVFPAEIETTPTHDYKLLKERMR